jgi:hypothetical protein
MFFNKNLVKNVKIFLPLEAGVAQTFFRGVGVSLVGRCWSSTLWLWWSTQAFNFLADVALSVFTPGKLNVT